MEATHEQDAAGTAHCPGPPGTPREPDEPGISPYCDRWQFYACPRLGVGLFVHASKPFKPARKLHVLVPDIGIKTEVHLCGTGEDGYEALVGMGDPYDDPILPLDLFHRPLRLHPRPGRRVSQEAYAKWQALVDAVAQPRHRQPDRPAEDRRDAPDELTAAIASKLRLGMTRAEVAELLGPPHDTGGTTRKVRVPPVYKYETAGPWHVQLCFVDGPQGGLVFAHAELNEHPHTHVKLLAEARWPARRGGGR